MPIKEARTRAINNIIPKDVLREIQLETIDIISDTLANSYGPKGSTTQIRMDTSKDSVGRTEYTKDGHKILGCIRFSKPIEMSIVGDLQDITRNTVKRVGDGTTSAVILSKLIFNELYKEHTEHGWEEKKLTNILENEIVPKVIEGIKNRGRKCTIDDIYNIALTSTDGNEEIANQIKEIYNEYGMGVFIDVKASNNDNNMIKSYDGVSFEQGYFNSCFINNTEKSVSEIRNPKIYIFEDAIDTPEMMNLLSVIITNNIIDPMRKRDASKFIPTVIFSTKFGEDVRSSMDDIFKYLKEVPPANRPPLLMITNISKLYQLYDLATLCGANTIKKYIDPEIQKMDEEKGLAATPTNIDTFAGTAEMVTADATLTKVINPVLMRNSDGTPSAIYTGLLEQLKSELKKYEETREELAKMNLLRKRIMALECNLVDFYISGISHTDRNALIDWVEDAVLNCRSAAENGVTDGANFTPLVVLKEMIDEYKDAEDEYKEVEAGIDFVLLEALYNAYKELYLYIYRETDNTVQGKDILKYTFEHDAPLNIRTKFFDGKVLTSVKADQVILEAVCKIIGLVFKTNQAIVADPMQNTYVY